MHILDDVLEQEHIVFVYIQGQRKKSVYLDEIDGHPGWFARVRDLILNIEPQPTVNFITFYYFIILILAKPIFSNVLVNFTNA